MVHRTILTVFLLALLAGACGDDGGATDTGPVDTGTADTGASDSAAPADSGAADTGALDGGADSALSDGGADGAPDAVADAGSTDVVITEVSVGAWANCMPIVPADPLRFFVELSYDNTAGSAPATAIITSAVLTFDDAATSTTDIDLDVEMVSIAAGATETQTHTKTTSTPVVSSCTICASDRTVTYDFTVSVDGVSVPVSGSTTFDCTF